MGMFVILACAILGILGLLFTHQALLTSHSSIESHVLLRGDRVELLADAAVQEAMALTQFQANDGRSGEFKLFRQLVLAPDRGAFSLSAAISLSQSETILGKLPHQGFKLHTPSVEVIVQKHLDDIVPYERQGFIRYRQRASVPSVGRYRAVERQVELVQSFKTVLLNPPHPYCHFGLFIADVSTMTDVLAINPNRDGLLTLLRQLRKGLSKGREYAKGLAGEYDKLLSEVYDEEFAANHARRVPGCSSRRGACYGLYLTAEDKDYDMQWLDLAQRLYEQIQTARAEQRSYEPPSMSLALALYKGESGAHRRVLASARRAWAKIKKGLDGVHEFNENFTILPARDGKGRPNDAYIRLQNSKSKLGRLYWEVRAQFRVDDQEGFDRFLKTYHRPRGAVICKNDKKRLALTGDINGQLVIVAGRAGAYLEDFGRTAAKSSNVTVVVPDGKVTLSGHNHCALVVGRNGQVEMVPGASLTGALITAKCPRGPNLTGKVTSCSKYFWDWRCVKFAGGDQDGPSLNKLFVGFSPKFRYRKVTR